MSILDAVIAVTVALMGGAVAGAWVAKTAYAAGLHDGKRYRSNYPPAEWRATTTTTTPAATQSEGADP